MNLDRINKWLALGANIGVVVGLAILILEMRHNASLSRTAIEVQKNALFAQIELSIASSDTATVWMKSVYHPEELTDAEIRILDGILASATLQWDYTFQMEAAGLIDKSRVASHLKNSAPYYFGSTFGKNWYNQQAIGWADTIMSEIADPIISGLDENFLPKYYESLRIPKTSVGANQSVDSTPVIAPR